jgi:hypothetical protein
MSEYLSYILRVSIPWYLFNEEDGIIKVEFIKSTDNDSYITKNIRQEMYERHVKKFLGSIESLGVHECFVIGRVLRISSHSLKT